MILIFKTNKFTVIAVIYEGVTLSWISLYWQLWCIFIEKKVDYRRLNLENWLVLGKQ